MSHSKALYITLPPHLSGLMQRFQVNCVPECCGEDAYDFDPIYIGHAIAENGKGWVEDVLTEIQPIQTEIDALPDDWEVVCSEMCTGWPKKEAQDFFAMLAHHLQQRSSS